MNERKKEDIDLDTRRKIERSVMAVKERRKLGFEEEEEKRKKKISLLV